MNITIMLLPGDRLANYSCVTSPEAAAAAAPASARGADLADLLPADRVLSVLTGPVR